MSVSILLPSIGRESRLKDLLRDINQEVKEVGAEVVLIFDARECGAYNDIDDTCTVFYTRTIGYWRCLNIAMSLAKHETILWTADDIKPHADWLKTGLACFRSVYPNGLGIVGLNDLLAFDATCGHAITTKNFMKVLFEDGKFPEDFAHLYLDTMIANMAKDLGRYHFCENAITEHIHHKSGKVERDATNIMNEARAAANKDKHIKDAHDQEWYSEGKEKAFERLRILETEI